MSDIDFQVIGDFKTWSAPAVQVRNIAPQLDELVIDWKRDEAAEPEQFTISTAFEKGDIDYRFSTGKLRETALPPSWGSELSSDLASNEPACLMINPSGINRLAVAVSEVKRKVLLYTGVSEETTKDDGNIRVKVTFFSESEAPLKEYHAVIRFDRRAQFYADTMADITKWFQTDCGCPAATIPALAYAPIYSSWYTWHRSIQDTVVEEQMDEAAKYGLRGVILDDGWQKDDDSTGYAFCGDWEVSRKRFSDFAEHVKKVHEKGMYYMLWYAVSLLGMKSKKYQEFKDKILYTWNGQGCCCLDPRFPEVRDYLAGIYERAVKEWDLDGMKLDFIDAFSMYLTKLYNDGKDPAVAQNYAGRDIKSISEAVDKLMAEAIARIKAVKPNALIEFRQSYFGPAIRKFGTMFRASDCPGDCYSNRIRTIALRLTCGDAPVHSDMLMWLTTESVEVAARQFLNVLFSVPQISVDLLNLPAEHQQMLHFWLEFWKQHSMTLLHGNLRPYLPQNDFAVVTAENDREEIAAVYSNGQTVPVSEHSERKCCIVNASDTDKVVVDNAGAKERHGVIFDAMGNFLGEVSLKSGLQYIKVPVSGLAEFEPEK